MLNDNSEIRISVVMALHNAMPYLPEAIGSILSSAEPSIELIAVDDCSTDGSFGYLKQAALRDTRIRIISVERNVGPAAARNKGMSVARGAYIAIFDADDISLPNRLRIQSEYLDTYPDVYLVGTSFQYMREDGMDLHKVTTAKSNDDLVKALPKTNAIHNPTVMFRNDGIRYREKFLAAEDYDMWLRILSSGKSMVVLPDVLLSYRIRGTSITNSGEVDMGEYVKAAREFYLQRLRIGSDSYDFWRPVPQMKAQGIKGSSRARARELKFEYRSNVPPSQFRENTLAFWSKVPWTSHPVLIAYYCASYLPKRVRQMITRILKL